MNDLERFKRQAGIPADFGAERPYVRLASVDESKRVGADADVEFDGDQTRIKVTVTEWALTSNGTDRTPVMDVAFDLATGRIVDDEGEALSDLLVAIDGMRVLSGEDDA